MLTQQGFQYYEGQYLKKKIDKVGQYLRYELLVYPKETYGQIINNLIATQGRLTIKTNWNLGYKVNEYFVDKNGDRYIINDVVRMEQEINPQIMFFRKTNPDTDFVLSLTKIERIDD